jgi:Riboflavin synthase alpha chain
MFSGIVEEVGVVESLKPTPGGARLVVKGALEELKLGDSVAVNGVCLTLVEWKGQMLSFDLSQETLSRSNLKVFKERRPSKS